MEKVTRSPILDENGTPIESLPGYALAVIIILVLSVLTPSYFPPPDYELVEWLEDKNIEVETHMGYGFAWHHTVCNKTKFKHIILTMNVSTVFVSDGCAGYTYWTIPKQEVRMVYIYEIEAGDEVNGRIIDPICLSSHVQLEDT